MLTLPHPIIDDEVRGRYSARLPIPLGNGAGAELRSPLASRCSAVMSACSTLFTPR